MKISPAAASAMATPSRRQAIPLPDAISPGLTAAPLAPPPVRVFVQPPIYTLGGRPAPEYDAAAYAFEQSADDEPHLLPRPRKVAEPDYAALGLGSADEAEGRN